MKSPAPDRLSAQAVSETIKDKQTLVLFLLGLALLFFDFWPNPEAESPNFYMVSFKGSGQPFQVLGLPGTSTLGDGAVKKTFSLPDRSTLLPLVPSKDFATETPASLTLFFNHPLPINRADKAALEMLPWVGPHLAGAIVAELQRQGRFTGPDDLLKVSGIGPKNMQRLLPLISFE